jgi:hypothetical protein
MHLLKRAASDNGDGTHVYRGIAEISKTKPSKIESLSKEFYSARAL